MYLYETSNTRKRRGLVGELGMILFSFFVVYTLFGRVLPPFA